MKKTIKKLLKLYKEYEEVVNYLIIGGLTTVVSLGTKYLLLFTILEAKNPIELQVSVIISWICAVTFAYFANRKIVFKSKNKDIIKEMSSFFGGRLFTLGLEMLIMWFFVTLLKLDSDLWVAIWTLATQIIILVLNYIISKLVVFSKK